MNGINAKPNFQNLDYVEKVYAQCRRDPDSVPAEWRERFAETGQNNGEPKVQLGPTFKPRSIFNPAGPAPRARGESKPGALSAGLSERVYQLIRNYRVRGHIIAATDPLGSMRPCPPELQLEFYEFTEAELDLPVKLPVVHNDAPLTIREIFQRLRDAYCRSIGTQFMHIDDMAVRQWLARRIESPQHQAQLTRKEQLRILTRLTDAVIFEEFLRKKFLGAKTFSLEGCETLLPLLDLALERAGQQGVQKVVIGMGHRGRLNVLAHVAGKRPREIFHEFADDEPELWQGRGDVKYHKGHSGDWQTEAGQKIHVSLCFNPSHLEFVDPVVLGRVRAQQERLKDQNRRKVMGLIIHGDAAFAGEGVVQETLNLTRLAGYEVGGALHVVVNNQIGFTTLPGEGRSTVYATDVARMLQAPIFHVNGEDPEAVAQVVRLAMDFRHEFQTDVFIDMLGYRRWGHNETDEPSFTQPVLYRKINQRPNVRAAYLDRLLGLNSISRTEAEEISRSCQDKLEQDLSAARSDDYQSPDETHGVWQDYTGGPEPTDAPATGVPKKRLAGLLEQLTQLPEGFHLHPKLERILAARREMAAGTHPLDWAAGEALAFATLATDGVRIRLSGQDCCRGTFSHRHAVLYDQESNSPYMPLKHLAEGQAPVNIFNSPLSEAAVLGFDYGFSLDMPDALVMWEAQFGDFVNVAQVILDQFITSAEDKWRRLSGLTLLLPHGFEGMGPEHSSARLERFLTLAAEDNIQVAQPTTPAQIYHLLRRQGLWKWRKPLVVLTPKSLLRHPKAVSELAELTDGQFQRVLTDGADLKRAKRVLLCSGKVYYDLAAHRDETKRDDVAIVRLEQLFPLRAEMLETALKPCADGTPVLWVQEEPANMGAWRFLHSRFGHHLLGRFPLALVSRRESASPATGSAHAHRLEQENLVLRAFGEAEKSFKKPRKTAKK